MSIRKYYAIARISAQAKLAYPADQISEIVFYSLLFSVLFFFQRTTLEHATSAQTEGLTLAQVMWIIFFVNIFGQRKKGVSHAITEEIQSGQIAYRLNRPCSYILFYYAEYMGDKIPSVLAIALVTGILMYFFVGLPPTTLPSLFVGTIMLLIGATISFFIQFCIGLSSFWIGNSDPFRWIYRQVQSVAGGAVIPVALFPATVKKIVLLLPFANTFYGAARVIVDFNIQDLYFYLGLQLMWLLIIIMLARTLYSKGLKNVVVGGG